MLDISMQALQVKNMIPTFLSTTIKFITEHPLREDILNVYVKNKKNDTAKRIVEGFIYSLGCDAYECAHLENRIRVKLATMV